MEGLIKGLVDVALGADYNDDRDQPCDKHSRSFWAETVSGDQDHLPPLQQWSNISHKEKQWEEDSHSYKTSNRPHKEQYCPQQEGFQSESFSTSNRAHKLDEDKDGWQTIGKPSRQTHQVLKENWHNYKLPPDEQQYSNDIEVGACVEPSEGERADLSRACDKLWDLDLNHLIFDKYYEIDCGEVKKAHQKEDMAQESLFTWVSDDIFRKPTFACFLSLLDNYNPHQGSKEVVTSEETQEQASFIEEISRTTPIKYLHKYLASKGITSESYQDFKRMITSLWFYLYGYGAISGSSSTFEHVFVGEIKQSGEVSSFHN